MQRVLVTGASGFVASALAPALVTAGKSPRLAFRTLPEHCAPRNEAVYVGNIGPDTDWGFALTGIDAVVHLAARVHVMNDPSSDPLAEFRRVNVDGTLRLAEQSAAGGVRHFVYVSSVKVHGEATGDNRFREGDRPAPVDPYAVSKFEAEQRLAEVAARTGLAVTVVRPPLVYGPGVGANFLRLVRTIERGVPLPLGAARNRRSLIYVGNLVDALIHILNDPRALGRTFLVSDAHPVSTAELVRMIAAAAERPARLFPVPPSVVRLVGNATGRSAAVGRLFDSLEVDSSLIRKVIGWVPPYTIFDGLKHTVDWLRASDV